MSSTIEWNRGRFSINDNFSALDMSLIHDFLCQSYWAREIPYETMKKSFEHSLCFGLYDQKEQIGFCRVVTDYATFAYLADVFVLPEHRGLELGR